MPVTLEQGLVDSDLRGSVLHKGDVHLIIRGRLADGRHAGVMCTESGIATGSKLIPVDPANENYKALVAAVASIRKAFDGKAPAMPTRHAQAPPVLAERPQDREVRPSGAKRRQEPTVQASLFGPSS